MKTAATIQTIRVRIVDYIYISIFTSISIYMRVLLGYSSTGTRIPVLELQF